MYRVLRRRSRLLRRCFGVRRYRFCLLHIRVHRGVFVGPKRFSCTIHAAANERASGRADCAAQCAAKRLLPKFGKAEFCIRVSGQNVEAVVCCILRGFLPAFAESLTRHCPQYAGAAARNQFRALFKRQLVGNAGDSAAQATAQYSLIQGHAALFQLVLPVACRACAHDGGNQNGGSFWHCRRCCKGRKVLHDTADCTNHESTGVVKARLCFLVLILCEVQHIADNLIAIGGYLIFSPHTLCACNAVKHLLEFRRSDRTVRSVGVGPAHLNQSVPLLVGGLQIIGCCLILRDVHAFRLATDCAGRGIAHVRQASSKAGDCTKSGCTCTACQRVHAQRGGIGVMLVLQLPVFSGFGLSLLLKLPHTLVCCGQTCIQLLCREILLCHRGPGFGSGFLFCCRCLRGLDAA